MLQAISLPCGFSAYGFIDIILLFFKSGGDRAVGTSGGTYVHLVPKYNVYILTIINHKYKKQQYLDFYDKKAIWLSSVRGAQARVGH